MAFLVEQFLKGFEIKKTPRRIKAKRAEHKEINKFCQFKMETSK
jgi:hypothetical protein